MKPEVDDLNITGSRHYFLEFYNWSGVRYGTNLELICKESI